MSTIPQGIHWVLVPVTVPGARSLHFNGTATCPHHTSEHYIVAPRADAVASAVDSLAVIHRLEARCHCAHRELVIKGEGSRATES